MCITPDTQDTQYRYTTPKIRPSPFKAEEGWHLSRSCSRAAMKKCTACAFSSTRKDSRPKKCTMPPMACSMACHVVGGAGGGFAGSNGAPVCVPTTLSALHQQYESKKESSEHHDACDVVLARCLKRQKTNLSVTARNGKFQTCPACLSLVNMKDFCDHTGVVIPGGLPYCPPIKLPP